WQYYAGLWTKYRGPVQAGAALLLVALILMSVVGYFMLRPAGQLLTVTKPVGGTLSATGIRCGTHGNDCSTSRPKGEPIELLPEADAGFVFAGYTGDCAPGGRTLMNGPRTCGARFDSAP